MPANYYFILGVPASATQADIKAAYRRLAKELHPDYYGQNQTPFQALQEAYSVLSNPESRQSYDASLEVSAGKQRLHRRQAQPYVEERIEPLIPEAGPPFSKKIISEAIFSGRKFAYHRRYDYLFADLREEERAFLQLLARLRVLT